MSIPRTSVTQRGSRTLSGAASVGFRSGRDRADMAATLAHELAHAVTHDACTGMPRDVCDVVAEVGKSVLVIPEPVVLDTPIAVFEPRSEGGWQ
jgi:predicted HD phosphohydrolase